MNFCGHKDASEKVRNQIDRVVNIWERHLGDNLVGVYLHGSMALECFCEEMSDIDLLIVTSAKMSPQLRRAVVKDILDADGKPCPLEMSAIYECDLVPWHHPTVCQFHYSDYHTENYQKLLGGELDGYFIADNDFDDPDIACHVTLTNQCGICLCGKPIEEVFPTVPEKDFINSLCCEIDDYDFYAYKPRYLASNILILGRVLSYFTEKRILSKYEAGVWARDRLPEKHSHIFDEALKVWFEQKVPSGYDGEELESLRVYLIDRIKSEMAKR